MKGAFIRKYLRHMVAAEANLQGRVSVNLLVPYATEVRDNTLYTRFYWGFGHTQWLAQFVPKRQSPEPGQAKIIHDYGIAPKEYQKRARWETETDLHFLKTYYPAVPADPPVPDDLGEFSGWIAPDGRYFVAHYGHHDAVARTIMATCFDQVMNGISAREHLLETWLQVMGRSDYVIGRSDEWDITPEQVETILKLQKLAPEKDWAGALRARKMQGSDVCAGQVVIDG